MNEAARSLPESAGDASPEAERIPDPDIAFGQLNFVRHEDDVSWAEWVVSRGIEAAEREGRPVDDRTARYIASFLGDSSRPALRSLAQSGAVDRDGLMQELVSVRLGQVTQVRRWIDWLVGYYVNRESDEPVEDWQPAIERQDRADAEQQRRERILATVGDLFEAFPAELIEAAGERDLVAVIRYMDSLGGLMLTHRASGRREVWTTDSEVELSERWAAITARSPASPELAWLYSLPSRDQAVWAPQDPAAKPEPTPGGEAKGTEGA